MIIGKCTIEVEYSAAVRFVCEAVKLFNATYALVPEWEYERIEIRARFLKEVSIVQNSLQSRARDK